MNLLFNFKDLFHAPRIAFRFQRLWINGVGLFAGYLIFAVLTYFSLVMDGNHFSEAWVRYGLLPCSNIQLENWYGLITFLVGVVAFFAIFLLTNTAISRVAYAELRREVFYTWRQAFRFAFRKWISVLGAMFTFLFMIAFIAIGTVAVSVFGRIPVIGELGSFLLIIPYLLAALLLLFICLVTFAGIFLVPAIIATSEEDSLGGVFQSFSIAFNQPARLIGYSILTGLLEFSGIVVLAFFLKKAYLLFAYLFTIGMGEKFVRITEHGFSMIDNVLPQVYDWMKYMFGTFSNQIYLSYHHDPVALSVSQNIAAFIFLIFLLVIGGAVLAYGEAIRNTGFTILYVGLYKIHEDENLLDREDSELNPDLEETDEEAQIQREGDFERTENQS